MFYTTETISPNISRTPEGFLVCSNVPITRVGMFVYGRDEVPVDAGASDRVQIQRDEDTVFSPTTMASFEGKPVTMGHPSTMVTPANWKDLAVGVIQNVRRGDGTNMDLLMADLLITDSLAISEVESKETREVSCGYEADYETIAPGFGRQMNIIGNHLALVDRGRAGSRCAIQDSHPCNGCLKCTCHTQDHKKETVPMTFKDKLKKLFGVLDEMKEEDLQELAKDSEGEGGVEAQLAEIKKTLDSMGKTFKDELEKLDEKAHASLDARFKSLDEEKEEEKETKDEDESEEEKKKAEDKKTKDAAIFQDTISRAEVIKPGLSLPAFDAATCDEQIKSLQIEVLTAAYSTQEGRMAIEPYTRGPVTDFASLDAPTLSAAFIGASEAFARTNNRMILPRVTTGDFSKRPSVSDINKSARDYWSKRTAGIPGNE